MTQTSTQFAGFTWPRKVPEFYRSQYNQRELSNGRKVPARMRFAYYANPSDHAKACGFYLASDFAPGLRWQWCDDVARSIRHTGWWTDEHGDSDTVRGIVARLPHGRGFLAGWSMGEGMASELEYTVYDDERDAAYAADSIAERVAERERDYQDEQRRQCEDEEI